MPTDNASRTVEVDAPLEDVLAQIRDVESQPEWIEEVLEAEVLEEYEDGTPATARFESNTAIGRDRYVLEYEHSDDGMTWSLVEGKLQRRQDGRYSLGELPDGRTEVTFELTIAHDLPAPGFIRRRVIQKAVDHTAYGLQKRMGSSSTS